MHRMIYTFGQKAVPANDIIMKFMAAPCITNLNDLCTKVKLLYHTIHVCSVRNAALDLLASNKQVTNSIVIFGYLFQNKIVTDERKFLGFLMN